MTSYAKTASLLIPTLLLVGGTAAHGQILDTGVTEGIRLDMSTSGIMVDTAASPSLEGTEVSPGATNTDSQADAALSFSFSSRESDESARYTVTNADSVRTAASLESYAGFSVRDDERLQAAMLEDNQLTLKYRTDAAFLGFIPLSMTVTAATDADGMVSVSYPWYSFLMRANESRTELETRLTSEQATISGTRDSDEESRVNLSSEWAQRFERLHTSLQASVQAEANT